MALECPSAPTALPLVLPPAEPTIDRTPATVAPPPGLARPELPVKKHSSQLSLTTLFQRITAVALLALLLFPPFHTESLQIRHGSFITTILDRPTSFVLLPPAQGHFVSPWKVAWGRLLLEMCFVAAAAGTLFVIASRVGPRKAGRERAHLLRNVYRTWIACALAISASGLLSIIVGVLHNYFFVSGSTFSNYSIKAVDCTLVLSFGAALGMLGSSCVMWYKFWEQLQDGQAITAPGEAIAFLFVPFFNIYWVFTNTTQLAQEITRCSQLNSIQGQPPRPGFMLLYWLLLPFCFLPMLGVVSAVLTLGVGVVGFRSYLELVLALAEREHALHPNIQPASDRQHETAT